MPYIIIIEEQTTTLETVKEYQIVGTKEVKRDYYEPGMDDKKTRIDNVYDYVATEKPVTRKVEVLKQTVGSLDITKVICAINNIDHDDAFPYSKKP